MVELIESRMSELRALCDATRTSAWPCGSTLREDFDSGDSILKDHPDVGGRRHRMPLNLSGGDRPCCSRSVVLARACLVDFGT